MRQTRFTESQIVAILHELDAGATAKEFGRLSRGLDNVKVTTAPHASARL